MIATGIALGKVQKCRTEPASPRLFCEEAKFRSIAQLVLFNG